MGGRGLNPRARICVGAAAALAMAAVTPVATAAAMARISVRGNQLFAGARPWRAWGMNWGIGNNEPVVAYFDDPTPGRLAVLRSELRTARAIGANSMRIYLQLGQVMATPTRPRDRILSGLQRLLGLAQRDSIYLDITGDLVWQPSQAPRWYGRMSVAARWRVQARFWKAVAHAAAGSPAVLCYELTSEPIVSSTRAYYYGDDDGWWFQQSIATGGPRVAPALARAWVRLVAAAVRSQDDRPVTIGLLPTTTGPFAPANVARLLDMLVVHVYPETGQAGSAVGLIHSFAGYGKPVLLGETFILNDDAATQGAFLSGAAGCLAGAFEFFDGRDPRTLQPRSIYDSLYQTSLYQFLALRPELMYTGPGSANCARVAGAHP